MGVVSNVSGHAELLVNATISRRGGDQQTTAFLMEPLIRLLGSFRCLAGWRRLEVAISFVFALYYARGVRSLRNKDVQLEMAFFVQYFGTYYPVIITM